MSLPRNIAFALLCLMPLLLAVARGGADAACVAIGILFLLHSAMHKSWAWLRQPEIFALACLWIYIVMTAGFSTYDPQEGLKTALIWGRFVLLYAAARYWLLTTPRSLHIVGGIGIVIVLLAAIDALWQYKTGISLSGRPISLGNRLTGPLGHPNIGNFLLKISLPMIGIYLHRAVRLGDRRRIALSVIILLIMMALILVSGERSIGLLTLMAAVIIGGLLFLFWQPARRWVLLGCLSITVLMSVLAATQPVVQERGVYLVQQLSKFWKTPYGQLYIAAGGLWREHPLTGIGLRQFKDACPTMMNKTALTYCDIHPHNMYLEWLVATGVIGFGLFVFAMLSITRQVLLQLSFKGSASLISAFSFALLAVVLFPLIVTQSQFANWPGILFWYSLAMAASLLRLIEKESA